jgi:branched-chain amino acid transport system ATP-binding protein
LQVLRNVSFTLEQKGSRVVIIGPNGAGKSTLFNVITGELAPTGGKVYLFEKDVTKIQCHHRAHLGLGRTFQIVDLFPRFTVMENALIALQAHESFCYQMIRPLTSYTRIADKANLLLERTGLWEKRDFLINALSYGEMRRVELLLGLCMEPRVLLLDEPTAGLTSSESLDLANLIQNLHRETTLLMIEHDMKVAFTLADRVIVLHQGEVLADGEPDEIRENAKVREVYLGEGLEQ